MSNTTQGFTVQGLTLSTIYADNNDAQTIPSGFFIAGNQITILDNTFVNVLNAMNMNSNPDNVLVQGNSSPSATGLSAYFTFIQGQNISVIGNNVNTGMGESLIRGGANGLLVADNTLNNNQKVDITIQLGTYEYIYANQIENGGMGVGPIGSPGATTDASVNDVVFEDNVSNTFLQITPGSHQIMVRDNAFTLDGKSITIDAQEGAPFNWNVSDVYLIHNTVVDTSTYGGFLTVSNGIAQNVNVEDNLLVAPKLQTGEGQGIISVDANNLDMFGTISDNVWAIPSPSGWAQGGYFYVNAKGGVQSGYLTPAEWAATGVPTGDVYENVTLTSTYMVSVNGLTAGANLPLATS